MEVRPERQTFERLARDHDVVPVVLELTSDTVTPFTVYSQLAAGGRVAGRVTGVDLIKEQIKIAAGELITGGNYYPTAHAIECRINAEDPETFAPSPGRITTFHPPGGLGVRVDTALHPGAEVSLWYDSLIAKVIVSEGLAVFVPLLKYMGTVLGALGLHALVVYPLLNGTPLRQYLQTAGNGRTILGELAEFVARLCPMDRRPKT